MFFNTEQLHDRPCEKGKEKEKLFCEIQMRKHSLKTETFMVDDEYQTRKY